MFNNLTAAFGFTVLCLAPIMLVALIFPLILMRFTRPKTDPKNPKKKRGIIGTSIAYARLYFISVVLMVMVTIVFWYGFITVTGREAAVDFASQSLPVDRETIEEFVEPLPLTETPQG